MKRKILFIVTVGIILAAGVWGYSKKQTYTDITAEENYLEKLNVALLLEEMTIMDCERIANEIPNAPVVVKGEPVGDREELYGTSQQKIKITKVYKGDNLQIGDEIYISTRSGGLRLYDEPKTAECGFVNVMKKNREYVVFLLGKVENTNTTNPVYEFYGESFIRPIFCYDDEGMEKKIVPVGEEDTYVPYAEVKNNEFFGATEKAHEVWGELKEKVFEVYK